MDSTNSVSSALRWRRHSTRPKPTEKRSTLTPQARAMR